MGVPLPKSPARADCRRWAGLGHEGALAAVRLLTSSVTWLLQEWMHRVGWNVNALIAAGIGAVF